MARLAIIWLLTVSEDFWVLYILTWRGKYNVFLFVKTTKLKKWIRKFIFDAIAFCWKMYFLVRMADLFNMFWRYKMYVWKE